MIPPDLAAVAFLQLRGRIVALLDAGLGLEVAIYLERFGYPRNAIRATLLGRSHYGY